MAAVCRFRVSSCTDITPEERAEAIAEGEEYWPDTAINENVEMHAAFPFQLVPPKP